MTAGPINADGVAPTRWSVAAQLSRAAGVMVLLAVAACAQVPTDLEARVAYDQANDPAEPTNRVVFAVNQWVDRNALQPTARAYENHVPSAVRKRIRSFTLNLKGPSILVNDMLQANFSRAWTTTQRFAVNTTLGGAGLYDVATDWDLPYHDADFGQTFGVWGVGPGLSLQLPLLGPSNVRDAAGQVAGFLANPLGFVPSGTVQTVFVVSNGVGAVDERAEALKMTDTLEQTSLDYYVALRSMHAQRRAAFVEEGRAGESVASGTVGPVIPAPAGTSTP